MISGLHKQNYCILEQGNVFYVFLVMFSSCALSECTWAIEFFSEELGAPKMAAN